MARITIAKFKEAKSLSEETRAFSCDVLLDGEKVCAASNEGHGGGNRYFPWNIAQYNEVIAADLRERGEPTDFESLDALIEALITDKELTAQAKKMATKKQCPSSVFFFDLTDHGWRMQGSFVGCTTPEQVVRAIRDKNPDGYRVFRMYGPETLAVVPFKVAP